MTEPRLEDEGLARARLAAIVTSSDDVIVSKTLEGIITSWNPAAERILGWSAAEAIGQSIFLIIPDDRREEENEVLARLRRGERIDHFDTVRRTKDGRRIDLSITVSPVRDESGRIVGASKVARDITERRRVEEQRAQLLAREQAARREAERLSRAKDELLATVSHELRTPLNSMFGWARMLQSGNLDEAGRQRAIETILRSVSAQARLIEDLLDLSRIAVGKMRLQLERMNLNATIAAAVETVRPAARAKDIALAMSLDEAVGLIQGAPDRLQQVIWNLLTNGVKFTPGGGRVEISSRREASAVMIVVKDTGRGIPPDVLPHIFEPFHQEDSSSTRDQPGLGLGLTLVRRLVELHGGGIRAESPGRDQGATFTVTLPLTMPPATRQSPEATDGPGRVLDGTRILVVADDPEFLELSAMILRREGADVRAVSSAAQAQELVKSWLPSVLLTDLAMPGEDGFTLASSLRTVLSQRRADMAIVAVTAYGTPEGRARAVLAGFDLYLTKPVEPLDLAAAVTRVIRRAS